MHFSEDGMSISSLVLRYRSQTHLALRRAHAPLVAVVMALTAGAIVFLIPHDDRAANPSPPGDTELSSQSKRPARFAPTEAQWASLGIEPVKSIAFRSEHLTEGKISINEDRSTPIFSPYAGRVTRLAVKAGDIVERGQPLFFIEATDMVQAQNDFLSAIAALNKARSRVTLTQIVERQNRRLYEAKAGPLRDLQTAETDVLQAQADQRTAETGLEAARNRLAILGKTEDEIAAFQDKGRISSETPIYSPIAGTVVQRRLGPGQYVSYTSTGSVDPVFVIGDLSTVWLVAYTRESDAPKVSIGQQLDFTVLAYPNTTFKANIDYVAAALDPASRRLMVRATINNAQHEFKPEMFASVTIYTQEGDSSPAISLDAVIYEAEKARVWVARDDRTVELREIKTGVTVGKRVQVLQGLAPGEQVVTKGGLFVTQAAGS
jgi:cobalt-zinc-cadmium efflux system membrane fusion protein